MVLLLRLLHSDQKSIISFQFPTFSRNANAGSLVAGFGTQYRVSAKISSTIKFPSKYQVQISSYSRASEIYSIPNFHAIMQASADNPE